MESGGGSATSMSFSVFAFALFSVDAELPKKDIIALGRVTPARVACVEHTSRDTAHVIASTFMRFRLTRKFASMRCYIISNRSGRNLESAENAGEYDESNDADFIGRPSIVAPRS
jgi:hypothetical protein